MSRRYRVVHTTTLRYQGQVRSSHNELRMTPTNEPGQMTLENRLRVKPMTWSHVYRDHWGSHVTAMECRTPHTMLDIESLSMVERSHIPVSTDPVSWEALQDPALVDRSYDWLTVTDRTAPGARMAELAEAVRSEATPRAAAHALCERLRDAMAYEAGVTGVHSSGEDALGEGRGVCQDFAHVTVGALRHLGIPARYVSGYLAPDRDTEVGQTTVGESHAWVEFWNGEWCALDPTNASEVGLDHITVARGRDYRDVPPFTGIYAGPAIESLAVAVSFTRLA